MMLEPGLAAQVPGQLTREDIELLALLRVKAICDRLGFSSTIQAVAWAARRGLV